MYLGFVDRKGNKADEVNELIAVLVCERNHNVYSFGCGYERGGSVFYIVCIPKIHAYTADAAIARHSFFR